MSVKDAVHAAVTLVALCLATSASAHVKPSRDVNNRYLKLTPSVDRVRLVYTVYIGEVPGRAERARLDRDKDGLITDAEANRFRDAIAKGVGDTLSIEVNGRPHALKWSQTYIGLGTPTTDAGSFAIDLITWVCLPPGKQHQLVVRDGFRIALPGETEVKIEDGPDVRVTRASLGPTGPSMMEMKWLGGPGEAATAGIHLGFEVEAAPPTLLSPGDVCGQAAAAGATEDAGATRPLLWTAGALALLLAGAAAMAWRRGRR